MKYLTLIIVLLLSFQAPAHDDHLLGDGVVHNLVHAVLLLLVVAVVVTGFKWLKAKSKQAKKM